MTTWQQIRHVGLPLSAPSMVGGFKIAYLQVVSTVVLAPLVGLGGLGFGVIQGSGASRFCSVNGKCFGHCAVINYRREALSQSTE